MITKDKYSSVCYSFQLYVHMYMFICANMYYILHICVERERERKGEETVQK